MPSWSKTRIKTTTTSDSVTSHARQYVSRPMSPVRRTGEMGSVPSATCPARGSKREGNAETLAAEEAASAIAESATRLVLVTLFFGGPAIVTSVILALGGRNASRRARRVHCYAAALAVVCSERATT